MNPPAYPWVKGQQSGYGMLTVEVECCRTVEGHVFSMHRLQTSTDQETANHWPGLGHESVAFALLVEAVRREAVLEVLILASKNMKDVQTLLALEPEARAVEFRRMGDGLAHMLSKIMQDIAPQALEGAARQIAHSYP